MSRREICGAVLIAVAVLAGWADAEVDTADRAAPAQDLLLYVGVPGTSIAYWLLMVAFLTGAAGLLLVIPALIRRIPQKIRRRTVGWTTTLAAAAAAPHFG